MENKQMNDNKQHWIYSFDTDKNISFAIASVLNAYYEKNYSFAKNTHAIQAVHNLTKKQAEQVITKVKEYIKNNKLN
jgi:NADH:ubiquinone oxidoreductase subunit E